MTLLLVALLFFALGWAWGHSTARVKVVAVPELASQNTAILDSACCETWWTSVGADHDATCQQERRTA